MKKLLTILLLLSTSPIFSQNHFIGIQGGASLTNVRSDYFGEPYNSRLGIMFGLNYQYQFKNKFQLGVDALYVQKGYGSDVLFVDINGTPIGEGKFENHYNYFSFPIKAGYSIGNKLSGFMNIGLVPSLLQDSDYIVSPPQGAKKEHFDAIGSEVDLDVAGLVELGASYKIQEQFLIFLLCNYQYRMTGRPDYGITAAIGLKYKFINE